MRQISTAVFNGGTKMRHILLGVTLVLCLASAGFAQEVPRFEIYGGGAFLRESSNFNRYGWVASFSTNVNRWFALKNEVGGVYNGGDNIHSFLLGPQFTFRRGSSVEPWAHFLVGPQHHQIPYASFATFAPGLGVSFARTDFAIEPGGGIDVPLNSTLGLRFGLDYVRSIRNADDADNYRAHAGVVFKLR
jgi:hypothetical protein